MFSYENMVFFDEQNKKNTQLIVHIVSQYSNS